MVSVIIPVYNTEKSLLLRCLDSILLQAFPDYEIIIVDDGCKTLAQSDFIQIEQMDSRIKILHQQNRGVSAARNAGVNAATGEYVAFVDGDDEIDSRFLADSVSTAVQSRADLVVGAIQYVREDGSVCRIDEDDTPYCFDQQDLISARRSLLKLPQKHFPYEMLGSPCGRLIRRELCLSTPFHESIHYLEDQLFVRSLFLKANRIVYLHHVWYYYYQYSNSSLHSKDYRTYSLDTHFLAAWNQLNFEEPDERTRTELLTRSLHAYISSVKFWILPSSKKCSEKLSAIRDEYSEQFIQTVVDRLSKKNLHRKDRLIWILLRHHMFRTLFFLLSLKGK